MDIQTQQNFRYLFERVGEPLSLNNPRGRDTCRLLYDVSPTLVQSQSQEEPNSSEIRKVAVSPPSVLPDSVQSCAQICPRSTLYSYFNTEHRQATEELRHVFLEQPTKDDLLCMLSACRDLMNSKLWINAGISALLFHPQTKNLPLPAIWEVMPDQFFNGVTLRQAAIQAQLPEKERKAVEHPLTGNSNNPENLVAYFREDIGINSHHWHWHLIYRQDDKPSQGRRKGELFMYMHRAMLARYDCERLANGLSRVKPLLVDNDPVILQEGYFGKLVDSNSAQIWGTRQDNTPLVNVNRVGDENLPLEFRTLSLETLRKWRKRIMKAINTGKVKLENGNTLDLNIDILGDMLEASALSPNPQYYGAEGVHNIGHVLIAHAHDPEYKHLENGGPMNDTTTAARDPIFYRWHKYIDNIFEVYLQTLKPYQVNGGECPLAWNNIQITNIGVRTTTFGSPDNILQTYMTQSQVDLSRGLDLLRSEENERSPVWMKFTHLNHIPFNYTINICNSFRKEVQATVRIYMAPRFNQNGERFTLALQRELFIEMDKFVETLRPGDNTITRSSTNSSVTIPWEQTFRDLERSGEPTAQQAVCGCGWPQHMLLPRGNVSGQVYDLVVFLTNADEDTVAPTVSKCGFENKKKCREALSYCGRLGEPYPDSKAMGYPFDRRPFTGDLATLDEYVSCINNMKTVQIRIVHDPSRVEQRKNTKQYT